MKRHPPDHANRKIHRERDLSALSRLSLLLFFGLALTGGFLFAARQHFAAIKYGYQSEELRREQQRLQAEQRRSLLEKTTGEMKRSQRRLIARPPRCAANASDLLSVNRAPLPNLRALAE